MKKLQLISMSTYCHKAKTWDKNDMIISYVQREDLVNHPYKRIEVPKMNYPKSLKDSTGLLNFFKSQVNQILP